MKTEKTVPLNPISDTQIQQYFFAVFELKLTKISKQTLHMLWVQSLQKETRLNNKGHEMI